MTAAIFPFPSTRAAYDALIRDIQTERADIEARRDSLRAVLEEAVRCNAPANCSIENLCSALDKARWAADEVFDEALGELDIREDEALTRRARLLGEPEPGPSVDVVGELIMDMNGRGWREPPCGGSDGDAA